MDTETLHKQYGIGLTGGIATGKSTVADLIRAMRILVIDADQISREVTLPGTPVFDQIVNEFGDDIVKSGHINRRKLRGIVFSDDTKRKKLESIIHPAIHKQTEEKLQYFFTNRQPDLWVYEASLLFETGNHKKFREVWICDCSPEEQISRLMSRDHCSREEALAIIKKQMPQAEKIDRADRVINTEGNPAAIRDTIAIFFKQIRAE